MSIEIRIVGTDAEAEQHAFISAYSFNGDRGADATARRDVYYPRDWCLAAFDAGEMVAGLVIMPFEQYIAGARIPLGGIASVSCLPERRRGGYVGALLRHALTSMRGAGKPLSALYTPHYSLYRKFGYELSARTMAYSFPPKQVKTRIPAPPGAWRRVGPDSWRELDALHGAFYATRNGAFARTELRWRQHVFADYGARPRDAAIWANADGQPRGYVVYHAVNRPPAGAGFGETILRVTDWVALDARAYAAVLNYLIGHDLASRIIMLASSDEPLADAFEEPAHIAEPPGAWAGMMQRLVDVPSAVEARPAPLPASGTGVTLALTDLTAPWNQGTWRLECGEGRMSAERTSSVAEIEMDVRAFASVYHGFTRPADAVRVGTAHSRDDAATARLATMFTPQFAPYCPDDF